MRKGTNEPRQGEVVDRKQTRAMEILGRMQVHVGGCSQIMDLLVQKLQLTWRVTVSSE